jgi:hypothetical protein
MITKKAKPSSTTTAKPTSKRTPKAALKPTPNPTPKPTSPPLASEDVATILATGSFAKEAKRAKSKKAVHDASGFGEPELATVHECVGAALLMLPSNLRTILGDKDLRSNALELETKEIWVIVREAGVVAYVHLPIIVKELEAPATALSDGVVLLDITGSPPNTGEPHRSNTVAKATKSQGPSRRSDAK